MDVRDARFNMIEQQIRPWDVLDQHVLDLLGEIPRGDFVPAEYAGLAYADIAVPIGHDQVMMHPKVEARMLQALSLHPTDFALEIGTGSAYVTALLARAVRQVVSVDIFPEFSAQAEDKLAVYGIDNVTLETGDATQGWNGDRLFDVIAITGSMPVLPDAWLRALNRGGRLFAVVGVAPVMEAVLVRRSGENEWSRESLFETDLPMLINAPAPARFEF
jgi:protein-L-isoaspartate(D-aspartate) O-methyltransferase